MYSTIFRNICNISITVEASLKNFNETPHFKTFIHKKKI